MLRIDFIDLTTSVRQEGHDPTINITQATSDVFKKAFIGHWR